jgi:hypothetical protein
MGRVGRIMMAAQDTRRVMPIALTHQLDAIIVGRVAVHGVDVIGRRAAYLLGCVLNHQSRPLDTPVGRAPIGGRAAPGEIGSGQIRLDLGHPFRRRRIVDDPDSGADQGQHIFDRPAASYPWLLSLGGTERCNRTRCMRSRCGL